MKSADSIGVLFWGSLGVLISLWSTRYGIGNITNPGPGLFPLLLGLCLIILSFILFFQIKKLPGPGPRVASLFSFQKGIRVVFTLLVLLAAVFLFERLGYLLSIFLLVFSLLRIAEMPGWKRGLVISLSAAFGVHLIFVVLLEQPLPQGWIVDLISWK